MAKRPECRNGANTIMTAVYNNFGNYQVVLADEDPLLSMVLAEQLKAAEISFCVALNGYQALKLIQQHRPQVIILDVKIAGLNGYDIVDALRRYSPFDYLDALRLIVYTSKDLTDPERKSLSIGAGTVFYTKTIEDHDMGQIVNQYLSGLMQ
jgi:CheY-like chemotaxis protein